MTERPHRHPRLIAVVCLTLAPLAGAGAGTIASNPLFVTAQADPRVLFLLSRDHQLSIKAYTDYSDLDGDGTLDTTYKDGIEYSGYFDPRKCYTYSTTNGRFEPAAAASGGNRHQCSQQWSGNFLNWGAMTRLDIVRKVLYGGYRSTDSTTETVLERAFLPVDVHAFAKVYDAGSNAAMALVTPYNTRAVITLCNVTNDTGNAQSKDSTAAPLIRIANGSYPRWAASEVKQCQTGSGTQPAAVIEDRNARVLVCAATGGSEGNCKTYPYGSSKPTGLIQQYGDADALQTLRFGLLTGSWQKNKSGGVLRRNVELLANNSNAYANLASNPASCNTANYGNDSGSNKKDEIDFCTGQFVNNQNKPRSANAADDLPAAGGVIGTLNRLRISSYKMDTNVYQASCSSPGITSFTNGQCVDWGNPLAEMYLESLRYFRFANGGTTASEMQPTPAFNANDAAFIPGLPQVPWSDPLPGTQWCAKSNIVLLSTGLNSFDADALASDLPPAWDATALTNTLQGSAFENLGGSFLIGGNAGSFDSGSSCTAKTLGNLADFRGICPAAPTLGGGYQIAGLAYGTSQYDLRPQYQSSRQALWGSSKPEYAARQPLTTFSVALAEDLPRFAVPTGSNTVTVLPSCGARSDNASNASQRACSMTDLIVEETRYGAGNQLERARFLVNWEDSSWGNDYDMDGIQRLLVCYGSACTGWRSFPAATDPTGKVCIKAAAMQANAGHRLFMGYTVAGTTNDGLKFDIVRPGGENANFSESYETAKPAGTNWSVPAWTCYTPSTNSPRLLENPLYYAAKYAAWPNWDTLINNATRPAGSDGKPDNFFQVNNPAGLGAALGAALKESLTDPSSASSISTNSTRLDTNTFIYQARFKALDWSGQLVAFPLQGNGALGAQAWDSAQAGKIPAAASRRLYTYDPAASSALKGVDFSWSSLNAALRSALDNANVAGGASPILDYLRGDATGEAKNGGDYRNRNAPFGDIVNSDPLFVGTQNFGYDLLPSGAAGQSSYASYRQSKLGADSQAKKPLLVVGANDGLVHVVDARNGNEVFGYVPSWLICPNVFNASLCKNEAGSATIADASPLRTLTSPGYTHRYLVDGSPALGDAYINPQGSLAAAEWRTVVVGTTAAGGKGVYAIDVTDGNAGAVTTASSPATGDPSTQSVYSYLAATRILWEFTQKNHADLGYTFGQPIVGRTRDGSWVAIFNNGYGSTAGKAVLYVVDLATGSLLKAIVAHGGPANGLSSPAAIVDAERTITHVYAGDLLGNVWKFDLSDSNPNLWDVAYKQGATAKPLFVARSGTGTPAPAQPITAQMDIGAHPNGGVMVYFGTGKYFENGDQASTTPTNAFYGIWDDGTRIDDADTDTTAEKNSKLISHQILAETSTPDTRVTDADPGGAIDWTSVNRKRGWYLDLLQPPGAAQQGERVVSSPIVRNNRVIFTTMIPSVNPCDFGGSGWIMEVDALSGYRPGSAVFDLNGDHAFNSGDYVGYSSGGSTYTVPPSGRKSSVGMIKTPAIISSGQTEYKIASGTTGNVMNITEAGTATRPRLSWRQLR